jgi:uncharacterized protein
MKLDLDRQGGGRTRLAVDERLALGEDPELGLPAEVTLRGVLVVDNLESRAIVQGTLQVSALVTCDRCLEEFAAEYPADLEVVVVRARSAEGELDAWVIHQRTGEVDLEEPLREAALLALPQKMLCGESCRGLCPTCGTNLNRESCNCPPVAADPREEEFPQA